MQTSLDCLPCFLRQALYATRLCTDDPASQQAIMAGILPILEKIDYQISPPENAVAIYDFIATTGGCHDPFAALKKESTSAALTFYPQLKETIASAADAFSTAVKVTLAGNIIDYGSQQSFDISKAINSCLQDLPKGNSVEQFLNDVEQAQTILYLGDNCGEITFDSLLLEILKKMGKDIAFAVKEKPIINDALYEDAQQANIGSYCEIISNGTGVPGTPLPLCSKPFQKVFRKADLIISKGQGNFETLSGESGPIYFLLTVKCNVVAHHISLMMGQDEPLHIGDTVLLRNSHWENASKK